jgi:hypothetical protein
MDLINRTEQMTTEVNSGHAHNLISSIRIASARAYYYRTVTVTWQVFPPGERVSVKVVVEKSRPVRHDPPVEFEKLLHVPLLGENLPLAGPFAILQISVALPPRPTSLGLAKRIHVGDGGGGGGGLRRRINCEG